VYRKDRKNEKPVFTGSRIEASEFLILMLDFEPPLPNVISQVTPIAIWIGL
jgi:hypothetical protein